MFPDSGDLQPPEQPTTIPGVISAEARQLAWLPDTQQTPPRCDVLGESSSRPGTADRPDASPFASKDKSTGEQSDPPHREGISWQWEHKSGFRDYRDHDNDKIEFAFQRGDGKVRLKTGKAGTTPMEIFFTDMLQYDVVTGNARKVRRVGDVSRFTQIRRFIVEFMRAWETGQPRRPTFRKYKSRQQALVTMAETFDVTKLYHTQGCCAKVARSSLFFISTMTLVFANSVWIGIEVDNNDSPSLQDAPAVFQFMEYLFCILFTIELLIRFGAFKKKRECIKDSWFCYDAALVFLMFLDTMFLPFMDWVIGGDDRSSVFRNVNVLRVARMLKLVRMTRLFRALPELLTMMRGIIAAFRSVIFTLMLELLLLYIFGIIFTTWTNTHGLTSLEPYFKPLSRSIYSLLVHGTFMDEPSSPLNDMIAEETPTLVTLFLVFIILSSLTVLNMLVGILFQVVADVSEAEKLKNETDYLRYSLLDILDCYDKNGDRTIGKEEFSILMKNPEVHDVLAKFGTDVQDLVTLTDMLFQESVEYRQGKLSFEELLQVVLRLRGEHAARVTDIVMLREYLRQRIEDLKSELRLGQQDMLNAVTSKVNAVVQVAEGATVTLCLSQDSQERRQLRRCSTTVADVLQPLCAKRGDLVAVTRKGIEVGPEITLAELVDATSGEVHLRLVQDASI